MSVALEFEHQLHRYSLADYHRLIETGFFDEDQRIELIDGLLVRMSPKSREHENAIQWLTRWLILALDGERYRVGVGSPLTLSESRSEPEPDLTVVPREAARPYHPATAALVIEVSVTSLRYDLRQKAPLYARAGAPEYWVVDLGGERVVVHRRPGSDGYDEVSLAGPGDTLASTAVPLPPLDVDELLRTAAA